MPLTTTKMAAKTVQRRLRRACEQVRSNWTAKEQRHRRLEAFHMQGQLGDVLGLQSVPSLPR